MTPTPPGTPRLALLLLLLPAAAAAQEAKPAPPVGEKPTAQTADQAFLRDQAVLLPAGRQTLELSAAYARGVLELGTSRVEGTAAEAQLAWRVGVLDDVQVAARLPWRYRRVGVFDAGGDAAGTRHALGDLSLGLFAVALREGAGWPNLIVSLDGVLPTGPGESGAGGGLAATRSYDPVILFCGVSYLHGFAPRPGDAGRTLARHNVGFNAGAAFAMNESVAVTGQLVGTVRNEAAGAGAVRPQREQYRIQLGVTLLVTPRLFVEPTVAVAVGTASPDLTLGLSVPWTL